METTEKMIELLDICPRISVTEEYIQREEMGAENEIKDFRDAIRPKKPLSDPEFESKRYYQVYEQKYGFQPNMSILDLLFNEGQRGDILPIREEYRLVVFPPVNKTYS